MKETFLQSASYVTLYMLEFDVTKSTMSCVDDPLNTFSNDKTFLHDFLVSLKLSLQNHYVQNDICIGCIAGGVFLLVFKLIGSLSDKV